MTQIQIWTWNPLSHWRVWLRGYIQIKPTVPKDQNTQVQISYEQPYESSSAHDSILRSHQPGFLFPPRTWHHPLSNPGSAPAVADHLALKVTSVMTGGGVLCIQSCQSGPELAAVQAVPSASENEAVTFSCFVNLCRLKGCKCYTPLPTAQLSKFNFCVFVWTGLRFAQWSNFSDKGPNRSGSLLRPSLAFRGAMLSKTGFMCFDHRAIQVSISGSGVEV